MASTDHEGAVLMNRPVCAATVAVLGADAAVGKALGHLCSGAEYAVKLLPDPLAEGYAEALAGTGLLLMAPALDPERKEELLYALRRAALGTEIPMVELPWPCGAEELKHAMAVALAGAPEL